MYTDPKYSRGNVLPFNVKKRIRKTHKHTHPVPDSECDPIHHQNLTLRSLGHSQLIHNHSLQSVLRFIFYLFVYLFIYLLLSSLLFIYIHIFCVILFTHNEGQWTHILSWEVPTLLRYSEQPEIRPFHKWIGDECRMPFIVSRKEITFTSKNRIIFYIYCS